MKKSDAEAPGSALGRREFVKFGLAGATMTALPAGLPAQTKAAKEKGVDWWDARPGKGGVGKPEAIDCHAHWSPEPYNKALADLGHPIENNYPLNYDLEKRLEWMNQHGVLMHCLTLSGSMPWQWTSAEQGAHLAEVINDAGIEVHKKHPERFVLGIEMPIRDPQLALKELNRIAGKPGVRAVHLPDSMERHDYIIDPNFAPVLARIEELGLPIIFHQMDGIPNNYGGDRVSGPPNLAAGLDAPTDHTVLATKLIMSGILDKYPKLEMVLPHAGGAFPLSRGKDRALLLSFPQPAHRDGAAVPGILAALLLRLLDLLSRGVPIPGHHGRDGPHRGGHGHFRGAGRRVPQPSARPVSLSGGGARPHLEGQRDQADAPVGFKRRRLQPVDSSWSAVAPAATKVHRLKPAPPHSLSAPA